LIAAQRRGLILDYIGKHRAGSIVEIADAIGTSRSSTRRDLDFLAEDGLIIRSRGGAVFNDKHRTTFEPSRRVGARTSHTQKAAIGRAARQLLQPGQSVIFDSSSTVLEAARVAVESGLRLTACTNDIGTAQTLSTSAEMQVVVLGGTVRPDSMTLVGEPGLNFLERLHVDLALMGIHSLAGARLSETSIEVAAMKRRMIDCAARVIVLADSSKFALPAFCDVCGLDLIDAIISDGGLDEKSQSMVRDAGVELMIAS
jgi:DeoR family transcriptional regulator, aga operon transcriptional repressor